jgi:hypothetical protein
VESTPSSVDLPSSCLQEDEKRVADPNSQSREVERVYSIDRFSGGKGEPLQGGDGHTEAGEATRPSRHREEVDLVDLDLSQLEKLVQPFEEAAGVGFCALGNKDREGVFPGEKGE